MNPFRSLREYEVFVYTLPQQFPRLRYSTLIVAQRSRRFAELTGEISFSSDYRLVVYERLSWDVGSLVIEGYSYEVWHGGKKIYWYDSQPHPDDPELASTHPHHKHVHPDIKHNRIPAPDLRFEQPNLPVLIQEIERDYLGQDE
ncbi:MAG TPA: hypothetical protein G4N94_12640 [Caldilineae bacterium]|nr:hypothetical protein [Caldilineae bacterium]